MILILLFVGQINFGFDDSFSFLENRFHRIRFNFKRDIFDFIHFLNIFFKFRYFLYKYRNICFILLLNNRNILICFLSNLSNLLIFIKINLSNLLLIWRFDGLKRWDSKWAVRINFAWTKINLLIKVPIMVSKTSWTVKCFALQTKSFYFFALMIRTCLCMNFFVTWKNLVFKI